MQLRITGEMSGYTSVNLGVAPTACWDSSMVATLPMREGTGKLDVSYGAAFHVYGHVDTTVLGHQILWDGEIHLPLVPQDLLIAGTTMFDPAIGVPATVHDGTDPVILLSTDVLSSIISITGISGHLRIEVAGSMATSYTTTALGSGDVRTTSALGSFALDRPSAGWGGSLELPVTAEGVVHYEPALSFLVVADLRIFGIPVVDYTLADVPMSLPAFDRAVTLAGNNARIPLPVLEGLGDGARIDFAAGPDQQLPIANHGEGPLEIMVSSAPSGITVQPVSVAAGGQATLTVHADVTALAGGMTASLALSTNDPDHPTIDVALGIDVGGTTPGDIGADDGGQGHAGGCSTAAPGGSRFVAIAFFALACRTRRRRPTGRT